MKEEEFYSIAVETNREEDIDRPYTELELNEIELTEEQGRYVPSFLGPLSVLNGFVYPFYSIWFCAKYLLCRFFFVETSLLICWFFSIIIGSLAFAFLLTWICAILLQMASIDIDMGAACVLFFIVFSCINLLVCLFVTNICMPFFLSFTFSRMSNVTEQIMKGNIQNLGCCFCAKSGKSFSFLGLLKSIFFMGVNAFGKYIFHKIVFGALMTAVGSIPVLGQIANFVLLVYECGYSCFGAVLGRKDKGYILGLVWCYRHFYTVFGVGLGALILYAIPGVNIFFYFYADVCGTLVFIHLQYRERLNKIKKEKKKSQEKDPLLSSKPKESHNDDNYSIQRNEQIIERPNEENDSNNTMYPSI